MIENYLVILEDSLKQKKTILEEIAGYNVMQEVLLKQEICPWRNSMNMWTKKTLLFRRL